MAWVILLLIGGYNAQNNLLMIVIVFQLFVQMAVMYSSAKHG